MRKLITLFIALITTISLQATPISGTNFQLNNWSDASLQNYIQSELGAWIPEGHSFTYLGRDDTGSGLFFYSSEHGTISVSIYSRESSAGTFSYTNTDGPELNLVVFVIKAGTNGWYYFNPNSNLDEEAPPYLIPFAEREIYHWSVPSDQALSFFAGFADSPANQIPDSGTTLTLALGGLLSLLSVRKLV
jgi:hypothetical protein